MNKKLVFEFKTAISELSIPSKLNNPFGDFVPDIAQLAVKEFQEYIALESKEWKHDFQNHKGKMFGILVVQKEDNQLCYIGTVSGKLPNNAKCKRFIPSIFDDSIDDFFINKGMTALTEIGTKIKNSSDQAEIILLREESKKNSIALQKRLFENYVLLNLSRKQKTLLEIFETSSHGNPPSAAGECAAPKLLQYAIAQELKPIAIAEFWWGKANKNQERVHRFFYPACKDRCRPILEYMLEDNELYDNLAK